MNADPAGTTEIHYECRRDRLLVSSDPARLDAGLIHGFLTRSYWAEGIPRRVVERSIAHYRKLGFETPARPETLMEILRPGIYREVQDRTEGAEAVWERRKIEEARP